MNKKICKHKFKDTGFVVLNMKYPRVISTCKRCGISVHRPVFSIKQLDELERKQSGEQLGREDYDEE